MEYPLNTMEGIAAYNRIRQLEEQILNLTCQLAIARRGLEEISDHPHCTCFSTGGSYCQSHNDTHMAGHRCAAAIATQTLKEAEECE